MAFILIDFDKWERREHYLHFINEVRCSYSVCVNLDISNLNGQRLYPAMLWLLTRTVNEMPEFRTSFTEDGLGYYSEMHPAYTVFIGTLRPFPAYGRHISRIIRPFCMAMRKMPENIPSLRSMSQSPEDLQIRLMFPWYRGFLLLLSI